MGKKTQYVLASSRTVRAVSAKGRCAAITVGRTVNARDRFGRVKSFRAVNRVTVLSFSRVPGAFARDPFRDGRPNSNGDDKNGTAVYTPTWPESVGPWRKDGGFHARFRRARRSLGGRPAPRV